MMGLGMCIVGWNASYLVVTAYYFLLFLLYSEGDLRSFLPPYT